MGTRGIHHLALGIRRACTTRSNGARRCPRRIVAVHAALPFSIEQATVQWQGAREVLCVRLDSLGDVLMTGPALHALRRAVPGRRITLLTSPAGARAAALLPGVDRVIEFSAPWMK